MITWIIRYKSWYCSGEQITSIKTQAGGRGKLFHQSMHQCSMQPMFINLGNEADEVIIYADHIINDLKLRWIDAEALVAHSVFVHPPRMNFVFETECLRAQYNRSVKQPFVVPGPRCRNPVGWFCTQRQFWKFVGVSVFPRVGSLPPINLWS
jgi:hypothetical protein